MINEAGFSGTKTMWAWPQHKKNLIVFQGRRERNIDLQLNRASASWTRGYGTEWKTNRKQLISLDEQHRADKLNDSFLRCETRDFPPEGTEASDSITSTDAS